jgi:hypothetical protein
MTNPYICSGPQSCGGTVDECDCAEQIAREERESVKELLCETCGLESPWEIFPSCLKCSAAQIAHNPAPWAGNRKWYVGTPWIDVLEAEVKRQASALSQVEAA